MRGERGGAAREEEKREQRGERAKRREQRERAKSQEQRTKRAWLKGKDYEVEVSRYVS